MAEEGNQTNMMPRLWVFAAQGEDLKNVAMFGKMSPYLEIEQAEIVERTATSRSGHKSPVWSQLIFLDLCSSSSPVKFSVKTGGNKLIGGFFLPPKYFRDGSRSSYTTIALKDSKNKFAGRIKIAWQLQYPHSVIGPPTASSRRAFDAFSKIPPRSRLMTLVSRGSFLDFAISLRSASVFAIDQPVSTWQATGSFSPEHSRSYRSGSNSAPAKSRTVKPPREWPAA